MGSNNEVLILGIDPGSINAGWALIRSSGRDVQIVKTGTCKLPPKSDFFKRIELLHKYFKNLVDGMPSYELALESLIYVKNVSSLAKLAQARGAILSALSEGSSCTMEYSPTLIKSTVSGYGQSSKQSLEKSLGFMFPNYTFGTHDESDALAIALCHSFRRGAMGTDKTTQRTKSRSLKESFKHLK